MKLLIFISVTLSFTLSHAGRIDNYYRNIAKVGKIHNPRIFRRFVSQMRRFKLEHTGFYGLFQVIKDDKKDKK